MAILRSRLVSSSSPTSGSEGAVGVEERAGAAVRVVAVAADQSRPIDPEIVAAVVLGAKRKPFKNY